jgi:hypothetical protein
MAKATKPEYDLDGWTKAKDFGKQLISETGALNTMRNQVDAAYFMDWSSENTDASVKMTISPDPHNKLEGAKRLLSTTSPKWDVPREKNDPDTEEVSEKIEQMANTMWARSNSVQSRTVEAELALMGLMYDEMQCQVVSTQDILDNLKAGEADLKTDSEKNHWKGELANAEDVAARTPYLYEPILPTVTGWSRSRTGLDAHYSEVGTTVSAVLADWGSLASDLLASKKGYETITLCSFWEDRKSVV